MNFFGKIVSWLASSETPRWLVAVCFAASVIVNIFIDKRNLYVAETKAAVSELKTESTDLMVLANNYVALLSEGNTNYEEAKSQLSASIVRLHSELSNPRVKVNKKTEEQAKLLQKQLLNLQFLLPEIDHPSELGPFWVALKEVLDARNKLIEAFEDQKKLI